MFMCLRGYVVVPTTRLQRVFVIVYDLTLQKPFIRNHVVLQIFLALGFYRVQFFTLMLLDIFSNSTSLLTIIRGISMEAPRIGLVFYVFLCITVIFSAFYLSYFPESLTYTAGSENGQGNCSTVMACVMRFIYMLTAEGNIQSIISGAIKGDEDYVSRIFFDSLFYIIVGILLLNIVTGLMVDSFSALRADAEERATIMSDSCFICSLSR